MSPSSHLRIDRRTTVAVALLAAGGCTFDDNGKPGSTPSESPGLSDEDFDLGLLDEARLELSAMLDLVRRTSLKHVGLSTPLTVLVELHQTHDDLLADSTGEPSTAPIAVPVPVHGAKALKLIRSREVALQDEFANLAGRARSGPLARVLASMSAAIGQYVAELPRPKAPA